MATPAPTRCLSSHDFAAPVDDRWFEDYQPGATFEYGYAQVTAEQIVEFAQRYDPQPMHVDVTAAERAWGGLIASGWHTGALGMRLFVDHYLSRVASVASPGMDELRWPRPVRPGDLLRLRVTVDAARVTRSDPTRGIVTTTAELWNQDDELAMSFRALNFLLRRAVD